MLRFLGAKHYLPEQQLSEGRVRIVYDDQVSLSRGHDTHKQLTSSESGLQVEGHW